MKSRMVQAAMALLLATSAGCFPPRAEPQPMHTYHFNPDPRPADARPFDPTRPVLLISLPQAEPGFETPRMVYVKRPHELEYYSVNQWADTPARMFMSVLIQALDRTGMWRAVIPLPGSVRGDYRLDSQGFALQQEFLQQPSRVRVTVRTQLVDLKESRVVGRRTFEAAEHAPSEDAYGGVQAANRAIAALLDQLASWLQECARHALECGP